MEEGLSHCSSPVSHPRSRDSRRSIVAHLVGQRIKAHARIDGIYAPNSQTVRQLGHNKRFRLNIFTNKSKMFPRVLTVVFIGGIKDRKHVYYVQHNSNNDNEKCRHNIFRCSCMWFINFGSFLNRIFFCWPSFPFICARWSLTARPSDQLRDPDRHKDQI